VRWVSYSPGIILYLANFHSQPVFLLDRFQTISPNCSVDPQENFLSLRILKAWCRKDMRTPFESR